MQTLQVDFRILSATASHANALSNGSTALPPVETIYGKFPVVNVRLGTDCELSNSQPVHDPTNTEQEQYSKQNIERMVRGDHI